MVQTGVLVEGSGNQTIVLLHAWSMSKETMAPLSKRLAQRFRVVSLDLPGHGDLAWLTPPTSERRGYAWLSKWLLRCVGQLKLSDALFAGWSLGAHAILQTASALKEAKGFAVIGGCPFGVPSVSKEARRDITEEALLRACFRPHRKRFPRIFREAFRGSSPVVRALVTSSVAQGFFRNEREIIAQIPQPIAILRGKEDQCNRHRDFSGLARFCWDENVLDVPGAGHAVHWERSRTVAEYLTRFAAHCFSS